MPIDTLEKWNDARKDVFDRYNTETRNLNVEYSAKVKNIKDRRKKDVLHKELQAKGEELRGKTLIELEILKEIREDVRKIENKRIENKLLLDKERWRKKMKLHIKSEKNKVMKNAD